MTITKTVRSRDDVVSLVPQILGFHPAESLVVLPIGNAPAARLDLGAPRELRDGLEAAIHYWERPVFVIVYAADQHKADELLNRLADILPGVRVHDAFRVHDSQAFDPGSAAGTPLHVQVEGPVLESRTQLADIAETVDDAHEAETMAWASYDVGRGATAWCFLERAIVLGGDTPTRVELRRRLEQGIAPDSWLKRNGAKS